MRSRTCAYCGCSLGTRAPLLKILIQSGRVYPAGVGARSVLPVVVESTLGLPIDGRYALQEIVEAERGLAEPTGHVRRCRWRRAPIKREPESFADRFAVAREQVHIDRFEIGRASCR